MRSRWIVGLVLCTAFILPGRSRCEDATPSLVVKIKSIEGLIQDVKYLAELAGVGEEIKQVDELLNSFKSEQGLGGIDTKKPMGMYGRLTDDVQNSPLLVMLPIVDEKAFLQFLGNFEIKAEKDKDGVYTVENIPNAPLPVTLYFRFANNYCYITINEKENIAKSKLPDPKKVLTVDESVISVSVRIADMPDLVKQLLVTNLENMFAELKEKQDDNEPASLTKLKEKIAELGTARIQNLLTDGESMALRLALDTKKDDLFIEAAFKAKSGSQLAKEMIEAGKTPTLFGSLAQKTDTMNVRLTATLPDELKKVLGPAVDDLIASVIKEETDQVKQALMKPALEKIAPTLKAGKIDIAMSMHGPNKDGHYTIVMGVRVEDGLGIESFVRDAIKNLPENERKNVKVDMAKVGSANIHEINLGDSMDSEMKNLIGKPEAYLAFRKDQAVLAMGPDALNRVKAVVAAKPSTATMMSFKIAFSRAIGLSKADPKTKKMVEVAEKVFGENPAGTDVMSITGEMTDTLRVRFGMKAKLIKLFAELGKEGIGGGEDK